MALTTYTQATNIIESLGTTPEDRPGMTDTRVLPLTGIHNFRDYGLYPVAGGGRVRPGLLWRSAQHGDAKRAAQL